jgi:hypothetical protein
VAIKALATGCDNRPDNSITRLQRLTGYVTQRLITTDLLNSTNDFMSQHRRHRNTATPLDTVQITATQRAAFDTYQHFPGLWHGSPNGLQTDTSGRTGKDSSQRLPRIHKAPQGN